VVTGRSSALTIPTVTVWDSPRGLPTAITGSPTTTASESPNSRAVRSSGTSCISSTARSVSGSAPASSAANTRASLSETCSSPPAPAAATTWLFVSTWPLASMITPEPTPPPSGPCTAMLTTLVSTSSATWDQSTSPLGAEADSGSGLVVVSVLVCGLSSSPASPLATVQDTQPATSAAASRGRRPRPGQVTKARHRRPRRVEPGTASPSGGRWAMRSPARCGPAWQQCASPGDSSFTVLYPARTTSKRRGAEQLRVSAGGDEFSP
jgi:hypothetical protein